MGGISYLDFDLLIQRAEGKYRAQVNSPAGQAEVTFSLPFSDVELENFLLRVGRARRVTRRIDSPEVQAAKTFGERLFSAVFADEVRGCLRSSIEEARQQGGGLRIRLHLTDAPELVDLPWEYLYNPALNRFLSLSVDTPVVRYLDLPERIQPLLVSPPLQVLVMISSPHDYPALEVEQEWAKLRDALGELVQRGLVALERLPEPRLSALQRALRKGTYHIFHFIGHGGFDNNAQDGVLVLEDEDGRGRLVNGQDLGLMLHDHRSLRLAVLNACEGARTSRTDPFAGTAQSLVQQGVAAVIAMQFEISDEAAITFAHEFYGAVADGYPVDAALAEARKAIFAEDNGLEWGTPVLYLRAPDGRIFDVDRARAPSSTRGTAVAEPTAPAASAAAPVVPATPVAPDVGPAAPVGPPAPVRPSEPAASGPRFMLTLSPTQQVSGTSGRFEVILQNAGTAPITFALSADDAEHILAYEFKTAAPAVPPGESMRIPLTLRPKRRAAMGRAGGARSFTVTAIPQGNAPQARTASGQFMYRLLIPRWVAAAALVVVGALALAALGGAILPRFLGQAPVVEQFAAEPAAITLGGTSMLRWRAHNATSVEITPSATGERLNPEAGQVSVKPADRGTQTFTLVARRGSRSVEQTVAITVRMRAPTVKTFSSAPEQEGGRRVVLSWEVADAIEARIDPQPGPVRLKGSILVDVPPQNQPATYRLTASNPDNQPVDRVLVVAAVPRPPVVSRFDAQPVEVKAGQQAILSWDAPGAETVSISGIGTVRAPSGSVTVDPRGTARYTLTASNAQGSVTQTLTVRVRPIAVAASPLHSAATIPGRAAATPRASPVPRTSPAPRASSSQRAASAEVREFGATPAAVNLGEAAHLCWATFNAQGARIEPDVGDVDPKDLAKGCRTISPKQTTIYTLTATGADGRTASAQFTIEVRALDIHVDLVAAKPSLISGEATELCWVLFNARSARLDPIGDLAPSELEKGCRTISPRQTTTYTLTVVGRDGRTVTKQLTVDVRMVEVQIRDFNAKSGIVRLGDTTQLCWVVVNARSLRIDPELGELSRNELERGCRDISPRETTRYIMTAVGPDGRRVTRTVLVVVPR